jgi:hypothetical protein
VKKTVTAIVLVLALAICAVYWWSERLPVMLWAVHAHASEGSKDCGIVRNTSTDDGSVAAQVAIDCAESASQKGQPFFVVFSGVGTDEQISQAVVADSHGNAVQLFYATGSVQRRGLFKSPCHTPLQLFVEEMSPYGFPRLHCAPGPPPNSRISRDFLLW